MKVLKALIEVNHDGGGTNYVGYPQVWLDNKELIPSVLYPSDRSDEIFDKGRLFQTVFPIVPDDKVDDFLLAGLEIADPSEVAAYSEKHYPKHEIIDDRKVVDDLLIKRAKGVPLTPQDEAALDPNKPEPGISFSKTFIDIANEYGASNI